MFDIQQELRTPRATISRHVKQLVLKEKKLIHDINLLQREITLSAESGVAGKTFTKLEGLLKEGTSQLDKVMKFIRFLQPEVAAKHCANFQDLLQGIMTLTTAMVAESLGGVLVDDMPEAAALTEDVGALVNTGFLAH